ncbi:MAG: amidohydrolase family protein [Armatimonadota bacterium]|nr:amidohydrolase family protein [Armatimonadota bacterium]
MNFSVVDINTHFGFLPYRDTDVSLGTLLNSLRKFGVSAALTYSLKGVSYDAEEGNDETYTVAQAHPELVPVATVDPRRHIGVIEEIEKRKKQGFVALRVFPEAQGWRISSAMFRPILRTLESLQMPLIVSGAGSGTPTEILQAVQGTTIPVIMCGIGYFNLAEALAVCAEHPQLYIEAQIIDTPDALKVGVEAIGAERFLFGSNHPSCSMRASLNAVNEAYLTDLQKALIFAGNARRLFPELPARNGISLNLDKPFEDTPIIDVHAHYGKWPFPMKGTGVDFTLDLMRRRGISKVILSSSYAIVYDFVEGNAQMEKAIEGYPELLGYITVNPNYFDASCRELEKYAKKPNFVGAKIHPAYCRISINSPKTKAMVRKIQEFGLPLLIHTYGAGMPSQAEELAQHCPDRPIIMGHGGADAWREAAEAARRTENLYMEFCSSVLEHNKVRRSIDIAGVDKILFGSDLDLIHPGFIAGIYEEAGLTLEEKEKILYKNATRVFNITL